MRTKTGIKSRKSLSQALKEIWIQFLAECVRPFMKDETVYMKFTRKLRFVDKVKTLNSQAWAKV